MPVWSKGLVDILLAPPHPKVSPMVLAAACVRLVYNRGKVSIHEQEMAVATRVVEPYSGNMASPYVHATIIRGLPRTWEQFVP